MNQVPQKSFITLTPELKSEKFGDQRESLCGKKSLPTVSSEAATKSLKRDLATFHRKPRHRRRPRLPLLLLPREVPDQGPPEDAHPQQARTQGTLRLHG